MALGHKLGGLKRTNWEKKKPQQKAKILQKHYEELGYKVPNYLKNNKIKESDFNRALDKVTKGYENKISKQKDYTSKKVPLDKNKLNVKLNTSIEQLNKTIDKTVNMLKDLGYSDKQIDYLKGEPIFNSQRKKPYFKDDLILEKEDINNLYNKTAKDIENSIKRIKKKTKQLSPKNYIKFITDSEDSDIFFEDMLNDDFLEDLEEIEIEHLKQVWDTLEPQEKEIAIKSQLDRLRQQYKDKYEKDWSDTSANNAFDQILGYLNGAKNTF